MPGVPPHLSPRPSPRHSLALIKGGWEYVGKFEGFAVYGCAGRVKTHASKPLPASVDATLPSPFASAH